VGTVIYRDYNKERVVSTRKIQNIQGLRGIAVLLVVFTHMLSIEGKYAQFEYIIPELFIIGESGVDLFFLISGFVMVAVTHSKSQSKIQIQKFLFHRVARIYPLYWFYTVLILGVYLLQPSLVNSNQGNQVNIFASFLLIPQNLSPLVFVGWTLIHEMYFYFVFTILLFLPRKHLVFGLICWGALVIIGNVFLPWEDNSYVKVYFSPLTLEFIAGAFIAILYYSRTIKGSAKIYALVAFSTWVSGYYIFQTISGEVNPSGWARVLVFGVPASFALYAALLYERNNGTIMSKWICKIGDISYSVYLSHVIVLSVVGRLWGLFAAEGYLDNISMLFIMLIAVLIAGYISYNSIEKYFFKTMRVLEKKIFSIKDV
jgi:peptidoglycan/LPS O-acetylase OafA/YrhL